jgi:beta-lactamase class D
MDLNLDCLFTQCSINLIQTLLAIMTVVSLNNFLSYVFEDDIICFSKKTQKKFLDLNYIKDANSEQLEAFWLTKKGKINKKQRRFLERMRKKETQFNEIH